MNTEERWEKTAKVAAQECSTPAQLMARFGLSIEVYGWAIKHASAIPTHALKELLAIITADKTRQEPPIQ